MCSAFAAAVLTACATSPEPGDRPSSGAAVSAVQAIDAFKPRPTSTRASIDYELVDLFLDEAVLDLGPSLRRVARAPDQFSTTRIRLGHSSRKRLEGNKVLFSFFETDTREAVRDYADSLIEIGNATDITQLSKNEQLAYWFNLHNMLIIAELAERYPVRKPTQVLVDGVPLHDAKLATINGIALSPRDIRMGIVYAHWDDPKVMYGFFHGDLASPSILNQAWEPRFVNRDLNRNAREFVNSLRGVDERGEEILLISPIYDEVRAFYFPNWPDDLTAHLLKFANEEVAALINARPNIEFALYEDRIADLAGGQPYESISPVINDILPRGGGTNPREENLPLNVRNMIRDVRTKFASPEFQFRLRRGTVTIIDSDQQEDDEATVD